MGVAGVVRLLLLPGVVLHEVAHATVATLLPGIEVVEVDLTSHVVHQGRYTILTSALVAYAPLLLNTTVALWALFTMARIDPAESLRTTGMAVGLGYVAAVSGLTAIPSWTDVTSPLALAWQQLFSLRGLVLLPVLALVLLVSLPFLLIAFARDRSFVAYVGLSGVYTLFLALVAFDLIVLPPPEAVVEQLRRAVQRSSRQR